VQERRPADGEGRGEGDEIADVSLIFSILARDNTSAALNSAAGGFRRTFDKISKITAVGMGAASVALLGFAKDAAESARIARITENVIKTTGGVAGMTADRIGDLATAISNKTGADDEAIQSGANLLLTFTQVRDVVGKGNDIFSQATATAVDMAAAMNNGEVSASGLKTANIQLGKALNDPIKGVGALAKVGVSFTESQKATIKSMVEAGDVMGAQKIILGELKTEFGGTAAAAADPMTRLTTVLGNLGETVGAWVLPYVEKFSTALADASDWLQKHESTAKALATTLGILGGAILVIRTGMLISAGVTALTTGAWAALATVLWANPIFIVGGIIIALGAAMVFAWKKSETFRDIVTGAWNAIVGAVGAAVKGIISFFGGYIDFVLGGFQKVLEGLGHLPDWLGGGKADQAAAAIQALRNNISDAVDWINQKIDSVVDTVHITVTADVQQAMAAFYRLQQARTLATGERMRGSDAAEEYAYSQAGGHKFDSLGEAAPAPSVSTSATGGRARAPSYQGGSNAVKAMGAGAAKAAEKVKTDLHKLGIRFGHILAKGTVDALKDGGKDVADGVHRMLDKIKASIDKARDIARGIRQTFAATAAIGSEDGMSFPQLMADLHRKADRAEAFGKGIVALRKAGLNKTTLAQLIAAGPDQGLAGVTALINGGAGALGMVNKDVARIGRAGDTLGDIEAKRRTGIDLNRLPNQAVIGRGRQRVEVAFDFTGAGDDALIKAIRKAIRLKGGDVQAVLGHG
jgi:hypothetical protein